MWTGRRLENLTTDCMGLATFSVSTAALTGDLKLQVQAAPLPGSKLPSASVFCFTSFCPAPPPGLHDTGAAVPPLQSPLL